MLPYFLTTAVVVSLTGLSETVRRSFRVYRTQIESPGARDPKWTFFDVLAVMVLIAFAGMRYNVGTDYLVYGMLYKSVDESNWLKAIEASPLDAGFTVLMLVVKSVTNAPEALFWLSSALTVIPIYSTMKRLSASSVFSVGLYILLAFYVAPFNTVRQGIAVALLFWASTYVDRKWLRWALLVLLASSFHASALLAALIQLAVRRWRPSLASATIVLVVGVVVGATLGRISFIQDMLTVLDPTYAIYLATPTETGIGAYLLVVAHLGLLVFAALISVGSAKGPPAAYLTYVFVGISLLIVGTQSAVLARMADYFLIYQILLLPSAVVSSRHPRAYAGVITLAAAAYFALYLSNYGDLVPYVTRPAQQSW